MKRTILLTAVFWLPLALAPAAQRYTVTAVVLQIDRPHLSLVASCSAIPGYMEAMVMPFNVRAANELDALQPGMQVEFTLVVDQDQSYAEGIHARQFEINEQEQLRAQRLAALEEIEGGGSRPAGVAVGETVPDFTLIDQAEKPVTLSQQAGKVVAMTFMYTSCPLPEYCFRLSNNLGHLQKRFAGRLGRDLVFLSVSFNPVHDTPAVLAQYAKTWNADPVSWHFLTGPLPDIKTVCAYFGLNFWREEWGLTHSLHTVVIDRQRKLAANFEGNQFTAQQLGDFIQAEIDRH